MKSNKTKYLILILIALFFASTNELSAKEAEQNYNSESHCFIETVNDTIKVSFNNNFIAKDFSSFTFVNHLDYDYSFNLPHGCTLNFIPLLIKPKIYLDISILRI